MRCSSMALEGNIAKGRPKLTWLTAMKRDVKELGAGWRWLKTERFIEGLHQDMERPTWIYQE